MDAVEPAAPTAPPAPNRDARRRNSARSVVSHRPSGHRFSPSFSNAVYACQVRAQLCAVLGTGTASRRFRRRWKALCRRFKDLHLLGITRVTGKNAALLPSVSARMRREDGAGGAVFFSFFFTSPFLREVGKSLSPMGILGQVVSQEVRAKAHTI